MTDLIAWLREQIDEDERVASAAANLQDDPENGWGPTPDLTVSFGIAPHIGSVHEVESRRHILRHDPARVLRQVEAFSEILDEYAYLHEKVLESADPARIPQPDLSARFEVGRIMIELLAKVYSDRPGYDEAVAP